MSLAHLFYCREAIRSRVKRWHEQKPRPTMNRFMFEPLEPRLLLSATPTEVTVSQALEPAAVTVPAGNLPNLDVDLNGQAVALEDGIVMTRYLFGVRGPALTAGAVDPSGLRADPTAVVNFLDQVFTTMLDVDANNQSVALEDGIVATRYLFGVRGTALTAGAIDPTGQRTDPVAIATFLDNMNPQRELVAPIMSAGLRLDTGSSAVDHLTSDPTIQGTIHDLNAIVEFKASLKSIQQTPSTASSSGTVTPLAITDPTFTILSPAPNATLPSGVIVIEFSAQNFVLGDQSETHLNFYVDEDPIAHQFFNGVTQEVLYQGLHTHFVHWRSASSIELHGFVPGPHRVRFVLADGAGLELTNPEASQELAFTVEAPAGGEFQLTPVYSGLNLPVAMAFAPDGRIFLNELRTGNIRVIDATGQLLPDPFYVLSVPGVGDQGLLGLALDPNFATNHFVYVYHSYQNPAGFVVDNRVVRLTDTNGQGTEATVLFSGIPVWGDHNGGIVQFGPDGKLYVTAGDAREDLQSQNLDDLRGKILRLNPDGSIPADNPFPNSPVYALGVRNSFGMAFHGHTGDLWATDNGHFITDEVNRIVAGGNYGWPFVEGIGTNPNLINPVVAITPTIGPTGIMAISEATVLPEEYHNNLLFTEFNNGRIYRAVLTGPNLDQLGSISIAFPGGVGPLFDIEEGPDHAVYVTGLDAIYRVGLLPSSQVQITDVSLLAVEDTEAIITWTTSLPATSQIEYGTSPSFGELSGFSSTLEIDHRLRIFDLEPGTTYHFRVRSQDASDVLAVSGGGTFTTTGNAFLPGGLDVLSNLQSDGTFVLSRLDLDQLLGRSLQDGSYLLQLRARDARGNVSGIIDVAFQLDETSPSSPVFMLRSDFDSPPLGDGNTTITPVAVIGQTDPAMRVVLQNGTGIDLAETVSDLAGHFTFNDVVLNAGVNDFIARAIDGAGNSEPFSLSLRLEAAIIPTSSETTAPAGVTTSGSTEALYTPSEAEEKTGNVRDESALSGDLLTRLDDLRQRRRFKDLTGDRMTAVIIDTGIDVDHPFFGPDADHNGEADRIVFQYDFADHDTDASDRSGHGSHIASLIGSEDLIYPGVAPEADLIALKVFSDTGAGTFANVEQALQWVIAHAVEYSIDVVNLSLGDGRNWTVPGAQYGIGDEFAALVNEGIIVVAAAGNNFFTAQSVPGVAYPAADPNVIGVGAVWTEDFGGPWRWSSGAIDLTTGPDRIASFSQRDPTMTEVFAPGARLIGANHLGGVVTLQGTSQAAAYLSGTALLAQQLAKHDLGRTLTPDEFTRLVAGTGTVILDGDDEQDNVVNTGETFSRLDVLQLAKGIHRYAAWERGEGGHHSHHGFALAYTQRCWVKDFVAGTAAESAHHEEELLIALPG